LSSKIFGKVGGWHVAKRGELLKGQMHCFTMQIVTNKCFLLNPEKMVQICLKKKKKKKLAQILLVLEKNAKSTQLSSKK